MEMAERRVQNRTGKREKQMGNDEIRKARQSFPYEWQRQAFDAFVLPADELGLTGRERDAFARQARAAVNEINWETYGTTRGSFLALAEDLLKGKTESDIRLHVLRRRMYVRFMEGRINYFRYAEKLENSPASPVPVGEEDFRNTELAAVFAHLPAQKETERWLELIDVSWTYDQLHMVTWFSGQLSLGSGKYSRSRPNHSARVTYERLLNPYSLLWIAAALGENPEVVTKAGYEMLHYTSWRAKCGVIRRAVPWKRIYELAKPLVEKERKGTDGTGAPDTLSA